MIRYLSLVSFCIAMVVAASTVSVVPTVVAAPMQSDDPMLLQNVSRIEIPKPAPVLTHPELDALWAEASRVVAEGDFEGYAVLFHPDAILVNGIRGTSYPIATALDGWKQGFDDTKEGKMVASVDFRFSERLIGETTAHETGIFRYAWGEKGATPDSLEASLIHFQALSVKVDGRWKMMMEYQISMATQQEWEALAGK